MTIHSALKILGATLSLLLLAGAVEAQTPSAQIESVQVGFPSYRAEESGRYKVGLWAPVAVTIAAAEHVRAVAVQTPDSEDIGTVMRSRIQPMRAGAVPTYAKAGNLAGHFTIKLEGAGQTVSETVQAAPMPLGGRLYLTAGAKLADFDKALVSDKSRSAETGDRLRFAAFIDRVEALPERWFGYQAVDLLILTTGDADFVGALTGDSQRVAALARWLRNGGRLVVTVDRQAQKQVADFFRAPAWRPPPPWALPPSRRPPRQPDDDERVERLTAVENWANLSNKALKVRRADLADLGDAADIAGEVLASGSERPLVVRAPYGRGSITLIAFDLGRPPFSTWSGRNEFLEGMVKVLEPPSVQAVAGNTASWDLATQLQRTLDTFDVPLVSFGWVAVLILAYILVVGPLDYLLLRKLLGRLEWTWMTFPLLIVGVSALLVFAAADLKPKELRVNKIDLVDFDLRTDMDSSGGTRRAYAYGQTWFTLLSPGADTYTTGVAPAMDAWGLAAPAQGQRQVTMSWLGRPELDGPGSYGRARVGFLRRPYEFATDAVGLRHVPIPVATSKAFTAGWEATLDVLPFEAGVAHDGGNRPTKITLLSRLPVPLTDVWMLHGNRGFRLGDLPAHERVSIDLTLQQERSLREWSARAGAPAVAGDYDPTHLMREILFREKIDIGGNRRNHALAPLDLSWRLREQPGALQEVILFGRVDRRAGRAQALADATDFPLPTQLWLGRLPGEGARPPLPGTMIQDTYIRAILPARSQQVPRPSATEDNRMIETRDLTKMYGDLYALERLTLKLERGDCYGFIGPNGAGKTTTMRILATLLNPSWGEATVCGYSIYNGAKEIRRLIGYMPDFFGVYDDMKVIEYLEFFAAAYRIRGPERRKKCEQVLEQVDLVFKRDALVTSLSRGMTQRLGLARVLLHEPQVLLLDEPASGLDPRARIDMRNRIKELRNLGKTIMVSSHILPELADICNKIGIIERGKLIFNGTLDEAIRQVRTRTTLQVAVAGGGSGRARELLEKHPDIAAVEHKPAQDVLIVALRNGNADGSFIADLLVKSGLRLTLLKEEEIDLEDVFMGITKGITS